MKAHSFLRTYAKYALFYGYMCRTGAQFLKNDVRPLVLFMIYMKARERRCDMSRLLIKQTLDEQILNIHVEHQLRSMNTKLNTLQDRLDELENKITHQDRFLTQLQIKSHQQEEFIAQLINMVASTNSKVTQLFDSVPTHQTFTTMINNRLNGLLP